MKKIVVLVAMAILAVPMSADAAARRGGRVRGNQPSWKSLASQLPGAYALLDRIGLSDQQKKVLGEVDKEWGTARRKAFGAVRGQLPRMSREDWGNAEKARAYRAKLNELRAKANVPAPVDQVSNVLSPEQLGKIMRANEVVGEWNKWLAEHLAKYSKKLDGILGPEVADYAGGRQVSGALNGYAKGAAQLASRLKLTQDQTTALQEVGKQRFAQYQATTTPLPGMLRAAKVQASYLNPIQNLVSREAWGQVDETSRKAVEGALTAAQRNGVAKAMPVLEERDKGIYVGYLLHLDKLAKILPVLKE